MRKPDPLDSDDHPESKKRSSAAAVITATPYKSPNVMPCGHGNEDVDTEVRSTLEVVPPPPPSLSRFVPALLYLFSFTRQKEIISIPSSFSFHLPVLGLLWRCTPLGH